MTVEERRNETESARPDRSGPKARRHAVIMRGVVTPICGLLAVAAIAIGALNATIWQPSRVITADAKVSGARYIVTDPSVLGLVDKDVKVNVKGGGDVCVAVAASKDAAGWLDGEAYVRLTGLSDWSTLSSESVAASKSSQQSSGDAQSGDAQSGQQDSDVAFKDSDMWRSVKCGSGAASLEEKAAEVTDVVLVDLGRKGSADVSFTWTRQTLPDYATPMYFVGGLLAVLAVLTASVFAMPPHKRRKRVVESEPVDASEEVSIGEAVAGSLGIKPSYEPKSKGRGRRRRHAAGTDTGVIEPVSVDQGPVVVDPASRNLVADAEGATSAAPTGVTPDAAAPAATGTPAGGDVNDEATSVISPDELQAYFARLAQEAADDDQEGAR
nr:hypothetical protein [Bifidobacterium platyrrhinorum]